MRPVIGISVMAGIGGAIGSVASPQIGVIMAVLWGLAGIGALVFDLVP